jgi:hypothetical protein
MGPPNDTFVCSPIGLVPKNETGKFRMIHDLSVPKDNSVNSGTPKEYTQVNYENF